MAQFLKLPEWMYSRSMTRQSPMRADDFKRAVGRAGIGDQDFIGDMADRFDAGTNVFDFVLARNQDGEAVGHKRFRREEWKTAMS